MANISETSINRPVLSTVMMLVILLFGFIGYRFLGVREFPSVDQPIPGYRAPIRYRYRPLYRSERRRDH